MPSGGATWAPAVEGMQSKETNPRPATSCKELRAMCRFPSIPKPTQNCDETLPVGARRKLFHFAHFLVSLIRYLRAPDDFSRAASALLRGPEGVHSDARPGTGV